MSSSHSMRNGDVIGMSATAATRQGVMRLGRVLALLAALLVAVNLYPSLAAADLQACDRETASACDAVNGSSHGSHHDDGESGSHATCGQHVTSMAALPVTPGPVVIGLGFRPPGDEVGRHLSLALDLPPPRPLA